MNKNFSHLNKTDKKLIYKTPLVKASIINRPNRYVAMVELEDGSIVRCHTPVGGRIGGLTIDNLPCLLSGPYEGRATDYTVEAIGLGQESGPNFQWLAINQGAANSYIKEFMLAGLMPKLTGSQTVAQLETNLKAEKKLDTSRIDFHITAASPKEKDLWIEVKTPLIKLHTQIPETIPVKTDYATDSISGRMPKQMLALQGELKLGKRVALLAAFGYKNTLTTSDELRLKDNLDLDNLITSGRKLGLESWQINFEIDPEGITLKSYERLK